MRLLPIPVHSTSSESFLSSKDIETLLIIKVMQKLPTRRIVVVAVDGEHRDGDVEVGVVEVHHRVLVVLSFLLRSC